MKCAYIFDIDGTIADLTHRLRYVLCSDDAKDWDKFYKACYNDRPIPDVIQLLKRIDGSGAEIIFVTGRSEICHDETITWINRFVGIKEYSVFMRKKNDHREDAELKKEIYEKNIQGKHVVLGVFEDRKQCVDMWRGLGLTCYQVADGDY